MPNSLPDVPDVHILVGLSSDTDELIDSARVYCRKKGMSLKVQLNASAISALESVRTPRENRLADSNVNDFTDPAFGIRRHYK